MTDKIVVHHGSIEITTMDEREPIIVPATLIRRSGEKRIAVQQSDNPNPRKDEALIKLIVRAHQARKALSDPAIASVDEAAIRLGVSTPYFCVILRLGYLAPDITGAILDGLQPAHINRQYLARINNLPVDWAAQRAMLGFA